MHVIKDDMRSRGGPFVGNYGVRIAVGLRLSTEQAVVEPQSEHYAMLSVNINLERMRNEHIKRGKILPFISNSPYSDGYL